MDRRSTYLFFFVTTLLVCVQTLSVIKEACKDLEIKVEEEELVLLLQDIGLNNSEAIMCTLTAKLKEEGMVSKSWKLDDSTFSVNEGATIISEFDLRLLNDAKKYCLPLANRFAGKCVAEKFMICVEFMVCSMLADLS